eukprot:scaffold11.g3902.t1
MATAGGDAETGEFLAERLRKARALPPGQRGYDLNAFVAVHDHLEAAQLQLAAAELAPGRSAAREDAQCAALLHFLAAFDARTRLSPGTAMTQLVGLVTPRTLQGLLSALGPYAGGQTCRAWDAELAALGRRVCAVAPLPDMATLACIQLVLVHHYGIMLRAAGVEWHTQQRHASQLLAERQPNEPRSLRFETDCVLYEVFRRAPSAANGSIATASVKRGLALAERLDSNFWQACFAYMQLALCCHFPDPTRMVATPAEAARLFRVADAVYEAAKAALPLRWLVVLGSEKAAAATARQFLTWHERAGVAAWAIAAFQVPHRAPPPAPHRIVTPPEGSCDGCSHSKGVELRVCPCRKVKYCSRECQQAHWPAHKQECKAARRAAAGGGAAGGSRDA